MQTESKSLLAKLLATENITVQHSPGVKTASFDLRNRILTMPVWQNVSNDLNDLLLGHETGHALDTPVEEYKEAIETIAANVFGKENVTNSILTKVGGFLNVVEDTRIDKRQKRRYPGLRRNYLNGYKELIERDFFGTANRDVNAMSFIDRINLFFKGGNIHLDIEFSANEKPLLKRVENLETFEEAVKLTEEIYLFCKEEKQNQETTQTEVFIGEDEEGEDYDYVDDSGNFGDDSDFDDEADAEDGEGSGDDQGNKSEGTQGSGDLTAEENDSKSSSGYGSGAGADNDDAPVSETDQAWQEKIKELVKDENTQYVYVNFPKVNWDKAFNDYKVVIKEWKEEIANIHLHDAYTKPNTFDVNRKDFLAWRTKEKESISFMVKEFEQRKAAEMYSRIQVAKTGVIDTNKLHTYKFNDDIFRRITTVPKGKNHGFVMFLDWSGSMHYNLLNTIKQLLSLCLFCKQIQVPFDVYAFKDSNINGNPFTPIGQTNVVKLGSVCIRNFISSRMTTEEFNFAASYLWGLAKGAWSKSDNMSGTPLNEAIILAPHLVKEFQRKNKVEIVNTIFLTDGDSNGNSSVLDNDTNAASSRYYNRYFYNDPETGKSYQLELGTWSRSLTPTLLKILKDKTNTNLIGFFLCDAGFRYVSSRYGIYDSNANYMQKTKQFWTDNKFFPVKSEGYDEYYVIDTNALKNENNELKITDKTKSTKQMAKAFSQFAMKKSVNRVLLRKFVEKIAGTSVKKVA